jgi:hypothetical protein
MTWVLKDGCHRRCRSQDRSICVESWFLYVKQFSQHGSNMWSNSASMVVRSSPNASTCSEEDAGGDKTEIFSCSQFWYCCIFFMKYWRSKMKLLVYWFKTRSLVFFMIFILEKAYMLLYYTFLHHCTVITPSFLDETSWYHLCYPTMIGQRFATKDEYRAN